METKDISLSIALEYLRSKTKGATSFVSSLAYTCVALGVAVLIIVSSVMNGFEKELRDRILNVIPHASISGVAPISDWNEIYTVLKDHPKVVGLPLLFNLKCSLEVPMKFTVLILSLIHI